MKKIYTIIFVSCLAAISFSSCSDWLDVRPADEIKEEYLFETGNGYRTALNGIYRKLATFDSSVIQWTILAFRPYGISVSIWNLRLTFIKLIV